MIKILDELSKNNRISLLIDVGNTKSFAFILSKKSETKIFELSLTPVFGYIRGQYDNFIIGKELINYQDITIKSLNASLNNALNYLIINSYIEDTITFEDLNFIRKFAFNKFEELVKNYYFEGDNKND